ncbi:MAG: hypothetical protein AB8H79_16325 [Myxococcota bacterium]
MDTLGGMSRTGDKVAGPASDLVELESEKGLKHLGITFHRKYRQHDALHSGLRDSRGFLESPDVCDLVELSDHVPESGAFIYPTGNVVSVARMLDVLARMGEPGGVKAGLELCYLVAQALQEASEKGERFGLSTHGDVSPWRIVCRSDGQVKLIGYGLPQIDMLVFREDPRAVPKEDAFRYCPPERITGDPETGVSDLFSLCLVAFELMVGEPLYNGLLAEIKQQATNAQGPYRLYQWRERLPESVVDLLTRALKFDQDARHADLNEFVWDVRDVMGLPEVEGPTLTDVVGKVRHRLRRKKPLQGGTTGSMTPEELAEIADELDGPRRRRLPEPKGERPGSEPVTEEAQRWGSVTRSGAPEASRGAAKSGRDRLKDRLSRSGSAGRSGASADTKVSLRDRLKRSRNNDDPPSRATSSSSRATTSASRSGSPERSLRRTRETTPEPPDRAVRSSSLLDRLRSSRDRGSEGSSRAPSVVDPPPATSTPSAHRLVVVEDADAVAIDVPADGLVCDLVYAALALRGGPNVSLTGVVLDWFRAEQGGEDLAGTRLLSDLSDEPVHLLAVPVTWVQASVEVHGTDAVRFRTPINSGLTAGAVVRQIAAALELDGDDWHISMDGSVLPALQTLGDALSTLGNPAEVTLVVGT